MKQVTGISFLVLVAVVGWKIGEHMTHGELNMALGVIFGMMFAVPAMLIAAAAPRHTATTMHRVDVYSHMVTETPPQPSTQPTALTVRSPKYQVVERDVLVLPVAAQSRIEVKR